MENLIGTCSYHGVKLLLKLGDCFKAAGDGLIHPIHEMNQSLGKLEKVAGSEVCVALCDELNSGERVICTRAGKLRTFIILHLVLDYTSNDSVLLSIKNCFNYANAIQCQSIVLPCLINDSVELETAARIHLEAFEQFAVENEGTELSLKEICIFLNNGNAVIFVNEFYKNMFKYHISSYFGYKHSDSTIYCPKCREMKIDLTIDSRCKECAEGLSIIAN